MNTTTKALAIALSLAWIGLAEQAHAGIAPAPPAPAYPLKLSPNHRYLVDQTGSPFLIAGDAPQSLMVNVSLADAEKYFANRQSHAFNSLWINLLCNDYTGGRPDGSTYDGTLPFTGYLPGHPGDPKYYDLSKPNDLYFVHCDTLIRFAARHGLLVFLNPIETGGWLAIKDPGVMLHNGPAACRAYGRYLALRYKSFKNILWLSGNDFQTWRDAASDAAVTAVALGLRDEDPDRLQTIELDYNVSISVDDPQWAAIVGLNAAYTYFPTYAEVLKGYNQARVLPVFLVEANYEFESLQGPMTTAPILRKQEYWTDLSGAAGQLYGNHHTWTIDHDWQDFLDTPGAIQMAFLQELLRSRPWYNLVPDQDHRVVTSGYGHFSAEGHVVDNDYLAAARTSDGTLVMAYTPIARSFTVDMTKLSAPATARWFDPTNGTYTGAAGATLPNTGAHDFATPGKNHAGDSDWVLVLEAPANGTVIRTPP